MTRQIAIAGLKRVKARLGTQGGKPGGPDMGGDQQAVVVCGQGDLEQVAGVEPQDGPAIGGDVAHPAQGPRQAVGGVQVGQQDQVMDLPGFAVFLVDGRYFRREQEEDGPAAGRRQGLPQWRFEIGPQAIKAIADCHQLVADLAKPARMHTVPGPDHRNALTGCPPRQMFQVQVAAGGSGIVGVHVQIGVQGHDGKIPGGRGRLAHDRAR
ncbi:hypothetical protein [Pararhodospirillum photometricum]|uniref:hypothetical protein n=1 Tax=Pararhodospirillum photometricum TaxID=1084 RepID=UPI0018D4D06D|nr:hypothetical protein [Pararhodospirillum photometricum]